jgi:hypothetical protein
MTIDDRLRAAGRALMESSSAQVDAAGRLQEIIGHAGRRLVGHGHTPALPDEAGERPRPAAPFLPPAPRPSRNPQRLAIAVNLLLVLVVGVLLVRAAGFGRDTAGSAPIPAATTVATQPEVVTRTKVPEACLDAADLADEVISRLNRNERDSRLTAVLRDYTIASQACRREASP